MQGGTQGKFHTLYKQTPIENEYDLGDVLGTYVHDLISTCCLDAERMDNVAHPKIVVTIQL